MFKSAIALVAAAPLMATCLQVPMSTWKQMLDGQGMTTLAQLLISTLDMVVPLEDASWYIQGGPAIVAIDGEENETRYSGKVGIAADLTDRLGVYELSAVTATDSLEMDDLGVGGKLGATFSF